MADALQTVANNKPIEVPLLDIPKKTASVLLQRDMQASNIPIQTHEGKATWHSFRKSYVNALVRSGADVKTVMELARHSTASLTMEVYATAEAGRMRNAVESAHHQLMNGSGPPCCTYVENENSGKRSDSVNASSGGSYEGFRPFEGVGSNPTPANQEIKLAPSILSIANGRTEYSPYSAGQCSRRTFRRPSGRGDMYYDLQCA
jgi:hypothetical protein